jgi:hypothetical protein
MTPAAQPAILLFTVELGSVLPYNRRKGEL